MSPREPMTTNLIGKSSLSKVLAKPEHSIPKKKRKRSNSDGFQLIEDLDALHRDLLLMSKQAKLWNTKDLMEHWCSNIFIGKDDHPNVLLTESDADECFSDFDCLMNMGLSDVVSFNLESKIEN